MASPEITSYKPTFPVLIGCLCHTQLPVCRQSGSNRIIARAQDKPVTIPCHYKAIGTRA
jgi:hypothetical protein